jgi:hypothetical protein
LPVLSVLVVLGAIGLAAWMLLTSGDTEQQADPTPAVTQPTPAPSGTPSGEPTKNGDKGDDQNNNNQNDTQNNGGTQNNNNGGTQNDGGTQNNNQNDGGNGSDTNNEQNAQPVPQIPVYVFNQTTITGLAAETANGLASAGWNIVGVDNWVGNVPADTVYFYPGDREAAERLSNDFPDIERVWPASAPMPAGALTVILADTARK